MIGFFVQYVHVNKIVKTKNRYIPINVGKVGHFRTPKIHVNPSDHGGTLDGSRHFMHIFKVVNNVGYRGVLDPIYHSKQTFKLMNPVNFHVVDPSLLINGHFDLLQERLP
jgi:hypothetical protein